MPHFRRSALPSPAPSAPKTSPHARRHWIFGAACTLALTLVVTGKALAAVMVEYALLLVAVLLLAAADTGLPNGHGFHAVAAHLQSASERAARA